MPLYEFRCIDGHTTEHIRSYGTRDDPVLCKCGKPTERLFPKPHVEPDGIYSYAPNIGSKEDFERRTEAAKRREVVDRS